MRRFSSSLEVESRLHLDQSLNVVERRLAVLACDCHFSEYATSQELTGPTVLLNDSLTGSLKPLAT
jgi:hypothetical protein